MAHNCGNLPISPSYTTPPGPDASYYALLSKYNSDLARYRHCMSFGGIGSGSSTGVGGAGSGTSGGVVGGKSNIRHRGRQGYMGADGDYNTTAKMRLFNRPFNSEYLGSGFTTTDKFDKMMHDEFFMQSEGFGGELPHGESEEMVTRKGGGVSAANSDQDDEDAFLATGTPTKQVQKVSPKMSTTEKVLLVLGIVGLAVGTVLLVKHYRKGHAGAKITPVAVPASR